MPRRSANTSWLNRRAVRAAAMRRATCGANGSCADLRVIRAVLTRRVALVRRLYDQPAEGTDIVTA